MYAGFYPGGDRVFSIPNSISLGEGDIPPLFYANTKVKLNNETWHQGNIISSWLCYSLLGEALGSFSNP